MDEIANKIYSSIRTLLSEDNDLSEPILYALNVKIASGSLGTHGINCYKIGQFTQLSAGELLNIASATELGWIIILMYDDILDNDSVRYGEPTAWVKYGREVTENAIRYGLLLARNLHPYKDPFDAIYAECLSAMEKVKHVPLNSGSKVIEDAYHGYIFGSYNYLLPFDDVTKSALLSIGYKMMLMAQLINDYKDTCGSRRKLRDYPEIRENQANYVTSLYADNLNEDERAQLEELIRASNSSADYEAVATTLRKNDVNILSKMNALANAINGETVNIIDKKLRGYITNITKEDSKLYISLIQTEIATA